MVMNRSTKKRWRWHHRVSNRNGREVMINFATGLSKSPTIRNAVIAFDAGQGRYESGMHFDVDGVEFVVALFTDALGTYAHVCQWNGSSLSLVEDMDWGAALMDLAGQIARGGNAP